MGLGQQDRVFAGLRDAAGRPLRSQVLTKATLTDVSHVLEGAVLAHRLRGVVVTGFQESRHWQHELDHYRRLAALPGRSVTVFAAADRLVEVEGVSQVGLHPGSTLRRQWLLLVLTDGLSAALLADDLGDTDVDDADRRFEAVLSLDPAVVAVVAAHVRSELARHHGDAANDLEAALAVFPPAPSPPELRDEITGELLAAMEARHLRDRADVDDERRVATGLRDRDRTKTAFLRAVSHELRTPATVVHGMAETLEQSGSRLTDEQHDRAVGAIVTHSNRLRHLLDDLLDIDQLLRDRIEAQRQTVDVTALTAQAVREAGGGGRVDVVAPEHLVADVDPLQFQRIVANLVTNAHKYAPHGRIVVGLDRVEGGLRLRVDDEGPGIPADERGRVLEAFHRVPGGEPRPGVGIGLTLVAEFARLHGGTVLIDDAPGGGARITVQLQAGEGPPAC